MASTRRLFAANEVAGATNILQIGSGSSNDSPVYRLPGDILALIFDTLAFLEPPSFTSLGWVRLSHVSREWRTLILDRPLLWSRVVCNFNSEVARSAALARSLDVPLSLYFLSSWWSLRTPDFRELAHHLMHRARLISSPDGLHRHGNFRLTGHLLPLLEELDIDVCNDDGNPLLAPSLWRLSIRTIPWNITAPHLRLLKVALNDRVECFNPYFAQIPKLLSAIPLLESFSFKLTAQYGLYEGEEGFSSAVHGARRSIQGVLTALDQGKPAVDMRHLKVMTIEANTRGSSQGQFAALLTTMLWRCLDASHLGDIRIVLSEQFHPLSELLDTMQKHVSSPRVDVLTITYQWPSLEFTLTNSNPDEASHCTFRLPSCDRTSFLDGIVYFSRDASRQLKTLRLVSLSTPGPDLGGQIGFRPRSGAYPSIESIEVYGPASLLTRVLWMYTFPQLQTIALHAPQHDHHELAGLAGELRGRPAKLKQFTLRGHTAYIDETKFAREIWALRLVDPAEVVIDEREGPETGSSHSRVFKAGGSHVSSTTRTQKPGAAGRAAAPVSAAARRRTDSIVGEVSARGARRSTESSTNGRSTWR